MDSRNSDWTLPIIITCICLGICSGGIVQRDAPCPDAQMDGSPSNTMHPTKGKELVRNGRTLKQEAAERPILQRAINHAESSSKFKKSVSRYGKKMGLDGNETLAIFCYTLDNLKPPLHNDFNGALRRGDDSKYPVYHYFLDSGIKKLAKKQGNPERHVYRGTSEFFSFPKKQTTLPGFTSTSLVRGKAKRFLNEGCTMFDITTRDGAYIKKMSAFPDEEEVLFPPYKEFTVGTYIKVGGIQTITLKSVGTSGSSVTTVDINLKTLIVLGAVGNIVTVTYMG